MATRSSAKPGRTMSSVLEAPVFYPSWDEWNENDPIAYIEKIRPLAEIAGICKIVPPSVWRPPFEVENTKSRFATRTQATNLLEASNRVRTLFELKFRKFCFLLGKPLKSPRENYRPDWCALYREVTSRGGSTIVSSSSGGWLHVLGALREANVDVFKNVTVAELRTLFSKHMAEFEAHCFYNLPVNFALRKRLNDRVSPSRMKTRQTAVEGIQMGSRGREAGQRGSRIGEEAVQMVTQLQERYHTRNKTQRKNKGRQDDSADDLARETATPIEASFTHMFSVPPDPPTVGDTFWKWFEDDGRCFRGTVVCASKSERGKRTTKWKLHYVGGGRSGYNSFEQEEEEDDLALMIACGATAEEATEAFHKGVCQSCNRANQPDTFVSCNDCDWRFHESCLLEEYRPTYNGRERCDWFCPLCIDRFRKAEGEDSGSESSAVDEDDLEALRQQGIDFGPVVKAIGIKELVEFGFPDGEKFSLEEYIENDKAFRARYEKSSGKKVFHSEEAIEKEFWSIATGRVFQSVEVNYGNDLDTGALGSGFPTLDRLQRQQKRLERLSPSQRQELEAYAASAWNLTNFPTTRGSLLQHIDASISGVIVPWLYIGMTFSAFCFHVEDHNFASVNYLHKGAPKSWWGTPARGADAFESAVQSICPDLFQVRPDLLQGIVTHFDPEELVKRGVPMYHLVQRAGEYVVTFPRAYHGGFNHGFNSAEAVNFAGRAWLEFGPQAVERYAILHKTPVIAHEALLLAIAAWCVQQGHDSSEAVRTSLKLLKPFALMVEQEKLARKRVEVARFGQNRKAAWYLVSHDASEHKEEESPASRRPSTRRVAHRQESPAKRSRVEAPEGIGGGAGSNRGERTVVLMGRVQKLSTVFNGVPRCLECRRYCCLSHAKASKSNDVFCLAHAPDSAQLFQSYDLDVLDDCLQKLAKRARPAQQWIECANRVCDGDRIPTGFITGLSSESSGGSPLEATHVAASLLANKVQFRPLFADHDRWRHKPNLEVAEKLLASPFAAFVDEASLWRAEVDRAKKLCEQIMALPLSTMFSLAYRSSTHQVDSMVATLDELWFRPPPCVMYRLAELRLAARA